MTIRWDHPPDGACGRSGVRGGLRGAGSGGAGVQGGPRGDAPSAGPRGGHGALSSERHSATSLCGRRVAYLLRACKPRWLDIFLASRSVAAGGWSDAWVVGCGAAREAAGMCFPWLRPPSGPGRRDLGVAPERLQRWLPSAQVGGTRWGTRWALRRDGPGSDCWATPE